MTRTVLKARLALEHGRRMLADVYTGYMVRHHLRFLVLTFVVILAAITALNVSGEIARVWEEGALTGTASALSRTGLYVLCRLLDNGSQIFGIAFLLGLVWAETAHAHGGRLMMVRIIGRTFMQRSTALFLLAALSVPVSFALDNLVRPWAFMTLSREGLGEYGWKYAGDRAPSTHWYAFGDTILRVVLSDAPEPTFERALLYRIADDGSLAAVATADRLLPPGPGRAHWTLSGATRWRIGDPTDERFGMPVTRPADGEIDLGFDISPLWLTYRDIEPKYVPLADLWRLTFDPAVPTNHPKYGAWLAIRTLQSANPGLVGLCVGALFALALDRRGLLVAAGLSLMAAYCGYFVNRLSALAVEHAPLPPAITASLLPVALAVLAWVLVRWIRRGETLPAVEPERG